MKGMKSYIPVYTCDFFVKHQSQTPIESTARSQWQTETRTDVQDAHNCKETYKPLIS